ncbi:MAG: metallophosphoesterase [Anaerolineaceae bacterium]|nr:metallophosphoesterase [Anaerolineaceae bacterium]
MTNLPQQTQLDHFNVTYHHPKLNRTAPESGVLEERWLHKLFLATHIPATWNWGQLGLGLVVLTIVAWLVWWPLSAGAVSAAAIYCLFTASDWLLLWWLNASGASFGPVGPQLLVKTVPRFGAVIIAALAAWLFSSTTVGLGLLFAFQLVGSAVYLWGTLVEPFALNVTHRQLRPAAWPAAAPPLRLLHLSDLHVERLTRRESHLLELIDQLQPDVMVITGDYLNLSYVDDPTARAEVRKILTQLDAPYGVYATLGSPPVDPRNTTPSLFDGTHIHLLRDEVAVIELADGRQLSLIGMDCEHDLQSDASALKNLLNVTPVDSARVLLYHSPELMPVAQQYDIDMYLCGHTHGGQIRMPFYGAVLTSSVTGKQYEMGPYTEQNTTLYVSRGIGLEGLSAPRMRLLCPPEIILFNLVGIDPL